MACMKSHVPTAAPDTGGQPLANVRIFCTVVYELICRAQVCRVRVYVKVAAQAIMALADTCLHTRIYNYNVLLKKDARMRQRCYSSPASSTACTLCTTSIVLTEAIPAPPDSSECVKILAHLLPYFRRLLSFGSWIRILRRYHISRRSSVFRHRRYTQCGRPTSPSFLHT